MSDFLFRYHHSPHDFSCYSKELRTCDLCGNLSSGYQGGVFYGDIDIEFVCETCLINGKLAEKQVFTNSGNLHELKIQIREKQPNLSILEVERLAQAKDDELIHRTPTVITWQDFHWPIHCADYCCFIKEAGKPDILEIAPKGRTHLLFHPRDERFSSDDEEFWQWFDNIRPDSPDDKSVSYSIGVYLFQCLNCQEYLALWDCD
ncbi:MAG: CbrC family protein [Anaerolineae bacterium]|nr:CbrC family protein [Anaerolineae bacterium]MBL8104362.1 CbrC family protein [Anaerolineales bacterium]MCC7187177.1 CbrC family protein [Anaerolineales bacterium]